MPDFATVLQRALDRPVVDQTGLSGQYDLRWSGCPIRCSPLQRQRLLSLPANGPTAPDLFTAAQQQLGLRIQAPKTRFKFW
jgi:uncharacterized protein (TIGR03435 family)